MKRNSQAFVNQLLVYFLVTICFGGSLGVATVWMRYQIADTARANRELAARIVATERLISEKTTQVETELRAEVLRRLNEEWRLGLVPMSDSAVQTEHVAEDVKQRLIERANRMRRELLTDAPAPNIQVVFR